MFLQVIFDEMGALNISINQNVIEFMQVVHGNFLDAQLAQMTID